MKAKKAGKAGSKRVAPIPKGYHSVTPYLSIQGAARALEFYRKAFGAKVLMSMPGPKGGEIGHAEIQVGDSRIMLADEYPDIQFLGPKTRGGTTVTLHLYVPNADQAFARAVAAGAQVRQPLETKFYGDRSCTVEDPFGHVWHLSTHVEDVSMKELKKRMAKMTAAG
jgi:PhnB protein